MNEHASVSTNLETEDESLIEVEDKKPKHSPWTLFIYRIILLILSTLLFFLIIFCIVIIIFNPFGNTNQCKTTPTQKPPQNVKRNQEVPILLVNITLYDGKLESTRKIEQSIYFEDGVIKCLGNNQDVKNTCQMKANTRTIQLQGRVVTPGLVDVHSHTGVYSFPTDTWAYADGNEMTDPTTHYIRAIDGLRTRDIAFDEIAKGGVTTSLVLPGSGNVIGGQGVVIKMKIPKNGEVRTIDDILVTDQKRYLKMACGENPKRVYGSEGKMPMSRMGSAWKMREVFNQARKLKIEQDKWDCKYGADYADKSTRPNNFALQVLVDLLNGDVLAHVHCYEVVDLEMAIRVSKEFGFKITTFHHALEAFKIPKILKENNISVAVFPARWGFKMEGYDSSVYSTKILRENGVSTIVKSDHPVIHGKLLMHHASIAHHYGLDEISSIASVTSEASKSIGLNHRIGTLEVGKDADIIVWNRHPLLNSAKPYQVWLEGNLNFEDQKYSSVLGDTNPPKRGNNLQIVQPSNGIVETLTREVEFSPFNKKMLVSDDGKSVELNNQDFIIQGVKIFTQHNGVIENGDISVTDGIISCVSTSCPVLPNHTLYKLNGGVVVPGFIESDSSLGLVGVSSESQTQDGTSTNGEIRAVDGISIGTRAVEAAWKSGVITSVTKPQGSLIITGSSVAFHTRGNTVSDENSLIMQDAALNVNIGNRAKSSLTPSVSSQIQYLRNKLTIGNDRFIQKCLIGNMTIALHGNRADYLARVLSLRNEFPLLKFVIVGGAEAFLIKDKLNGVPVILTTSLGTENWETKRSNYAYHIDELIKAGVKVGLALANVHDVREIRWEAASLKDYAGLTEEESIGLITSNVADIFNLPSGVGRIIQGTRANFALFDGFPLYFGSDIKLAVSGKNRVENPKQI